MPASPRSWDGPEDILLARLAVRGRESGGDVAERPDRAASAVDDLAPDIVIENIGDPHDGASRLVTVLRREAQPSSPRNRNRQ